KIRITHISDPAPSTADIGRLEIKVALKPLLSGTVLIRHLLIDDATVSIVDRSEADDSRPEEKPSDVLIPVLESVTLQNVRLTLLDEHKSEVVRMLLANLSLNDVGDEGPLYVKADGMLNSREFKMDGQLGSLADMLKEEKPYPMDVRADVAGLRLAVSGTMDNPIRGQGLNIRASGEHVELANTLRLFWEEIPNIGRMKFEALVTGDIDAPDVSSLDLSISGDSQLEFSAKGSITDVLGEQESNIVFSGTCSNKDLLKMFLTANMPQVSLVKVEGNLRHRQGDYFLENISLYGSDDHGLLITSSGNVKVRPQATQKHISNLNLMTKVTAPRLGAAAPFLGKSQIARLGPVKGEARITGTSKALSIDDIAISAGEQDVLLIECQGRVGKIPLSGGEGVSDIAMISSVKAQKAPAFASFFGISFLDIGPLKGSFRFIDQEGIYGFKNIQLTIGSQKSLWLKGAGSFDLVTKDGSVSLGGLDAEVEASAPNLAAIPGAADLDLPDLRPLKLKAHIIDPDGRLDILDVKELTFDAGTEEDAFLRIRGQASGLRSSDQRVLEASFKATSKPWVIKILEGSAPKNHVVEGKLKIAGTPKHIRIDELEVGTTGPKRLYLEAEGTVKEIDGIHEFEGLIASGASHISVLESFLGIDVPPFGAPLLEGQITGNTKKASFKGTVRLGSSRFRTTLSHSLTKQRPRVTAKIVAPTVHLTDVGVYPKQAKDLPPEIESEPQPDKRLFREESLPFHALQAIDLAIGVSVDKLTGEDFDLKNLNFDMSLDNGRLQVTPATVAYRSGLASIDFTIDDIGTNPEMALKVTAEDVDLGALLAPFHESPFLSGQLNLIVDLKSVGKSPREIATALQGEFGMAVEKGKIKRVVEFMGADAVDFLTAVRSQEEYKDLHCMALRFVFEEGMGKSEMIYMETPNMYARGGGSIDLHTETMEIALVPEPKKGFRGTTSPVHIKGPIGDPKVRKLPFREAARLFGEMAMPAVFLPARGLGYLWYLIRKDETEESPCSSIRPPDGNLGETR
ncbi:MAG: AsmA family protein, partial [Desulfobacterales bacterium]